MKKVTKSAVYDRKKLIAIGVGVLATAIVTPVFYPYLGVRLLLLAGLLWILWKNKRQMLGLIWKGKES